MSVFFTSRKIVFKTCLDTSSIPFRYLVVYRASSAFSYRNPNSFSIPSGSIENGSASSIASRYLVDQLSFYSWFSWVVPRHLFDTSAVDEHFLDASSIDTSIPLDTCICRDLLPVLFKLPVQFGTHFNWSLSRYFSDFSPKFSHLTLLSVPQRFFKLFQEFLHLVSF